MSISIFGESPKMADVKMTLFGPGYVEEAGIVQISMGHYMSTVLAKFEEIMKLIMRVRPELHSIVFQFDGYSFTKTFAQHVADEAEKAQHETKYRDSNGY